MIPMPLYIYSFLMVFPHDKVDHIHNGIAVNHIQYYIYLSDNLTREAHDISITSNVRKR